MAKKRTVKVEEVKAAETVVEAAPVVEEAVAEVVSEAPAVETPAAEAKATAKKPAAKRAAAKKTTAKPAAKKSAAGKAAVSAELFIQYQGIQVSYSELVEKAKAFAGVADPKSVSIYVKPEDYKVYYVIDEDNIGDFAL
ncbi:MAG: hypothetical protein J6K77_08040 [Ruminococcus sp.]|nr:hypothetical protein [Ruminococcus sp.]